MPTLLVLTQTHNFWGGIEVWMSHLFPGLENLGWNIHYGLARGARFNQPSEFLKTHPYIQKYTIMDGRVGTSWCRQQAISEVLKQVRPDLVLPLAIGDTSPAVRDYRRQGNPLRLVHALHSTNLGTLADQVENGDIIDGIGSVSGLLYEWTRKFLRGDLRLAHIRNGVPGPTVIRVDDKKSEINIGYVGRITNDCKRVFDIVRILDRVCSKGFPVRITIAGEGPSTKDLLQGINRLPMAHLVFLGYVSPKELYQSVYPHLNGLIFCSDEGEASPLVLIEAMRHGVVPISSRFMGHAAEGLLRPGVNCLTYDVGDFDAAADAIVFGLSNEETRLRLSANAIRDSASYDVAFMVREWYNFLFKTLNQPLRHVSRPMASSDRHTPNAGRLEKLGIPPNLTHLIRRLSKRHFPHPSGFTEWPASISRDGRLQTVISDRLREIDEASKQRLYADGHS